MFILSILSKRLEKREFICGQILNCPSGSDRDFGQAAVKLATFDAWSGEAWVNDGAAVRVNLVCFAREDSGLPVALDGKPVDRVYALRLPVECRGMGGRKGLRPVPGPQARVRSA